MPYIFLDSTLNGDCMILPPEMVYTHTAHINCSTDAEERKNRKVNIEVTNLHSHYSYRNPGNTRNNRVYEIYRTY